MDTPTIDDIADADRQIRPYAIETPLLEFGILNEKLKGRVFCKAEPLQRTGSSSFAARIIAFQGSIGPSTPAAWSPAHRATMRKASPRRPGFAAWTRLSSCRRTRPRSRSPDEPERREIVFYDRETEDRNAIARELSEKLKAALIPPFDDPVVIAGQGTAGLEIARQAKAAGAGIDAVLVPASGGGLAAGVALAIKHEFPNAEIWCVEPKGFDDTKRSLAAGTRQKNEAQARSICDALLMPEPGELTFALNQALLKGGVVVGDTDVKHAVAYAWRDMKLVLEPAGAIALAALLSGAFEAHGKNVGVVLSGGNVDPHLFADIICNIKELASSGQ